MISMLTFGAGAGAVAAGFATVALVALRVDLAIFLVLLVGALAGAAFFLPADFLFGAIVFRFTITFALKRFVSSLVINVFFFLSSSVLGQLSNAVNTFDTTIEM